MLDHIFDRLGIDSQGSVNHPVVLTEVLCNPGHAREHLSELLFEGYGVPRVAYGVDALFSHEFNRQANDTCLIVSSSHHATFVIPVVDGHPDLAKTKRVGVGGAGMAEYMQALSMLKHPHLRNHVSFGRALVGYTGVRQAAKRHGHIVSAFFLLFFLLL